MTKPLSSDLQTMKILSKRLLLLGAAGALACGGDPPPDPSESVAPVDVRVSAAVVAPGWETFPASVVASRRAEVATRMSGTVREVTVDVGEPVREGQPLVRLDDADVVARIESARAQAELAERSLRRVRNLHADGAASTQELDEVEADAEGARGRLRDAEAQLDYAVVRAPFDGFVVARLTEPGDLAGPGQPLLRIVGRGDLEVEADLPGDLAGRVEAGTRVLVHVSEGDVTAPARVARVVPALEQGSRRFRVEVLFDPPLDAGGGVVPGAYARLEIPQDGRGVEARWIPEDAVLRRGQLTGVMALEDGEIRLRWLRLGQTREGAVEVLAGPSDLIVVRRPDSTLLDGTVAGNVTRVAWDGPPTAVTVDRPSSERPAMPESGA
jgi:RND family efflux transporter MFP subunit